MINSPPTASPQNATPEAAPSDQDLTRFGIVARHQTFYEWNGFRYSHASDAIAAAKRAAR